MSKYDNKKKNQFLADLVLPSLDENDNDLTIRCKFNFSYFDTSQSEGQDFKDWSHEELIDLFQKLKNYTRETLDYWRNERCGSGGLKVLATYPCFPNKSIFVHPKYVPHQALWSRFRIGSKVRLVGFVIPTEYHNKSHPRTGYCYDKNTFYVVFLDKNHKFYCTENE
jgi:hypothetical protein